MTLGDIVKKYRVEHDLSLRDFSKMTGISNGYISMLEKNEHPKTKKPIAPSIDKMKDIASAMGMTLDSLLRMVDGEQSVYLGCSSKENLSEISKDESLFLAKYRKLNKEGKQKLAERADELLDLGYVQKGEEQRMA